jgi:hypothetical protein
MSAFLPQDFPLRASTLGRRGGKPISTNAALKGIRSVEFFEECLPWKASDESPFDR